MILGRPPNPRRHRPSVAVFRALLHRYPRRLRERYGEEMVRAFLLMLEEETDGAAIRGRIRVWSRVILDLTRPLPGPVGQEGSGRRGPAPESRRFGSTFAHDFIAAARTLRRTPGFTVLVVGVLSLGIALAVSGYSLIEAYLLRPLPFPEPQRLVRVENPTAAVSWTRTGDVFEEAVSWSLDGFTLLGDPFPEVVLGARVTPGFFEAFGVRPALGRTFLPEEGGSGGRPVAVISHELWVRRFGGDPGVLGRSVQANPADRRGLVEAFEIIGVLPEDFWYMNGYTQILLPMGEDGPVYVGRLRRDVPPERAEEALTALAVSGDEGDLPPGFGVEVRPLQAAYTLEVRPKLVIFQITALLVLLIAGVNAILLVLIRAMGRNEEMGIRQALGAGRRRLAAYLLCQGWILGLLAAGVAAVLASGGLRMLAAVLEARLGQSVPGGTEALHLGSSGLALAILFGVGLGSGLGLVPLSTAARSGLAGLIGRAGQRTTPSARVRRFRGALVAAEVALSLTLLSGGALMLKSALHLEGEELGFRSEDLMAFTVGHTSGGAREESARIAFFKRLEEQASRLPGIRSAGLVRAAPFLSNLTGRDLEVDESGSRPVISRVVPQVASPGLFEVLGLEPVVGRWFSDEDVPGSAPVAVVSQALAERAWSGESPLGRRVRFPSWNMRDMSEEAGPWLEVVGVAPDVVTGIDSPREVVYVPHVHAANAWMDLVVRSRPGVTFSTQGIQELVRELDPDVPLYSATSVEDAVSRARAPARFFTSLLGGFALISLALALLGFYGVAAYAFRQRRRDVAIRMVLGAHRGEVERYFVRGTLLTLSVGLLAGIVGGRYLGGLLRGQLHGVEPSDLASSVVVAGLLAGTSLLAAWIPARRAAGLDPMTVLREE